MILKCWTGFYTTTCSSRVVNTSLIKLSLAPVFHCVHAAVQGLHRGIWEKSYVSALPQLLTLTEKPPGGRSPGCQGCQLSLYQQFCNRAFLFKIFGLDDGKKASCISFVIRQWRLLHLRPLHTESLKNEYVSHVYTDSWFFLEKVFCVCLSVSAKSISRVVWLFRRCDDDKIDTIHREIHLEAIRISL